MYSIAICLATYNGEKYLSEQLDSLINQDYENIKVYIHDDGSSDNTIDIIKQYADKYPDIFVFFDDDVSYRNSGLNFMETLKKIPKHDFYMFCDQDDVWLENKVSKSLKGVLDFNYDSSKSVLVYTDFAVVDENLNFINKHLVLYKELISYESIAAGYGCYGCTMLFNHTAKELSCKEDYPVNTKGIGYHDNWVSFNILGDKNSKVFHVNDATILYRQHDSNVVGFNSKIKKKNNKLLKLALGSVNVFAIVKFYKKIKIMNKYLPKKVSFLRIYFLKLKIKYKM